MENINQINVDMAEIKKDIEFIKNSLIKNEKSHDKIFELFEKLDKKYCSKWVEKVFIWIGTLVGAIIIGALIRLIIIN